MTDSVNQDEQLSLFFDCYIESSIPAEAVTGASETSQKKIAGRTWEITMADTTAESRPQLFFAAKSGKLFNRTAV